MVVDSSTLTTPDQRHVFSIRRNVSVGVNATGEMKDNYKMRSWYCDLDVVRS